MTRSEKEGRQSYRLDSPKVVFRGILRQLFTNCMQNVYGVKRESTAQETYDTEQSNACDSRYR
jgi:hypothetical protein